jgi:uncharacterized membrane protein YbaN (DUF454 family)
MNGPPDRPAGSGSRAVRAGWLVLGLLCVSLGVIGAIMPLMPTTIFLIMAAGCFARSSPRLEAWLLDHPRFGPTLRAWRAEGAIPRRGKIAACCGIALGFTLFLIGAKPGWGLALVVATIMAGCATYIVSRPAPGSSKGRP